MKKQIKKFEDITKASSKLSSGTYTGTVPSAKIKKFKNITDASSKLSSGTYTGTVPPAKKKS